MPMPPAAGYASAAPALGEGPPVNRAHGSGSLAELLQRLAQIQVLPEAFFSALVPMDLADAAACLQYLRAVDLSGPGATERLLFHLDLLRNQPPASYASWARLLHDVRHGSQLSAASLSFVKRENIAERLHALLLQRTGLSASESALAALDQREHQVAYFRSMFRFLESLPSLLAADPNLVLVLEAMKRDGSLQAYYARDPGARRTVQRMVEAGYDVDYLVFGRQDILTLGPSEAGGPGGSAEPRRLRAVRSKQQVPEILFDNSRFASSLFKPAGLFHGEISRLLLDPATPMMELWLDPYPELLGLVTLYPGSNSRGERTLLMDTVDYDEHLFDLLGSQETFRFMLDAMVVDAHLSGAAKLLVFAAPHGRPMHFVNHVAGVEPQHESIVYHESYAFLPVDPDDGALARSRAGKHHYTVALGYNRSMRGVIDHGYNLVSRTRVEKHLEAGRGVFEIDVAAFLRETHLTDRIPKKEAGIAQEADAVVHRRPAFHAEEIARREEEAFARGVEAIHAVAPELTVERCSPSTDLLPELLVVETAAFPENIRYDEGFFRVRFVQQSAELLLVRRHGALVGFAFTYVSPRRAANELYLDNMALLPEYQGKGIGAGILKILGGMATVRGYTRLHALIQPGAESRRLVKFYQRDGFHVVGDFHGVGLHIEKPLGITGADNRAAVDAVIAEATRRLSGKLSQPRITFHTLLDPQLLRTMHGLEAAFPERLRFTSAQFRERMACQDAYALVVSEQGEPVGFALSYQDPTMPAHTMRLDAMSVRPDFQSRGIARELMLIMLGLPTLAGYTGTVSFCEAKNSVGVDLVKFYSRFVADVVETTPGHYRMLSPVRGPTMDCFKRYQK